MPLPARWLRSVRSLNEQDLAADRQVQSETDRLGPRRRGANSVAIGPQLAGVLPGLVEPLRASAGEALVVEDDDLAVGVSTTTSRRPAKVRSPDAPD